jgi:HK97 family phage major capsid protein
LLAKKLTGYTTVANELMDDSAIPLAALITRLFGEALAYFEDEAFINGSGAGDPVGILNADALVTVAKETGQAATTIVAENLDKMYARMWPAGQARAVWLANNDAFPALAAMSRSVGTGGGPVWVTNMADGPPSSIFGRPLIFTEKCQTLGTAGDIFYVDLGYYVIGDRQGLTMTSSAHYLFPNQQTAFMFTQRVDGKPWLDTAITPRYGTNTLSPFVSLATRA